MDDAIDDVDDVSDAWLIDVFDEPMAVDTIDDDDTFRCNVIARGEPDDTLLEARLNRR